MVQILNVQIDALSVASWHLIPGSIYGPPSLTRSDP